MFSLRICTRYFNSRFDFCTVNKVVRCLTLGRSVLNRLRGRPSPQLGSKQPSRQPLKTVLDNLEMPKQGPMPRVKLRVLVRCGIFTFAIVNCLMVGPIVWSFEHWREQQRRRKDKRQSQEWHPVQAIRRRLEQLIGRPLQPADLFWGIVALNAVILLFLRSPVGNNMLPYFTNSPYNPAPVLSMLLSAFSHVSVLHLGLNMYVLHSFSHSLIKQIGAGDYLFLVVGGGTFASLVGLLAKAARRISTPSIGASGGVCAVLSAFCLLQPDARLCVPFLVQVYPHSFRGDTAVWALMAVEAMATLLISRSLIDHAAHFGGLWFGLAYGIGGMDGIWKRRAEILSAWRTWSEK